MSQKSVYVVGTGTIGEPLLGLLCNHIKDFGLNEIIFHKRTPSKNDRSKVLALTNRGAKLAVNKEKWDDFITYGMTPSYTAEEALHIASVVIDCTPVGNENKELYYQNHRDSTLGFIAQGSEFGFGKMYARGINDVALVRGEDKFIQIVSCNTHNLAAILQTIAFPKRDYENLKSAKFLCIRRANDISQNAKFAPSPTVNIHKDIDFGTHHARDTFHLFKTLRVDLKPIFSSALKVNTQYMHTLYFTLYLHSPTSHDQIIKEIDGNFRLAKTWKNSANSVFSFGRDHGYFGRIFNQTVFCVPSIHVSPDGKEVTGFCFTPQDGNSILSSVAAALWYLYPDNYDEYLKVLNQYFFEEV